MKKTKLVEHILLPRDLVNQIVNHAQRFPAEEVCGLLSGKAGRFVHCFPVKNVAQNRRSRFEMDPKGQIDAMRNMRENDEELLGIFHSHPDQLALPSAIDLALDEYPGALHLIVSLRAPDQPELRCFRIGGKKVREVRFEIV